MEVLKKGDRVVYDGVETVCKTDQFNFLGTGPLVVVLDGFDGWINAKLPRKIEGANDER